MKLEDLKFTDLKLSRFIRGPAGEVFDVWFDPKSPGGPWHGAKKVMMNLAVDGMFYFGIARAVLEKKGVAAHSSVGLLGHFGRFTAIDRPRAVEHTWMSENTLGVETTVVVTFEARDHGTQLTILHRGIPDEEGARDHERGWTFLLSRLEAHFEGRSQGPAPSSLSGKETKS